MDDDPLLGLGLHPVNLEDQAKFESYFQSLAEPLSDYTFSQVFTWGNSLRIAWKEIRGHLCVFANGTGDLTLLMPPIGQGGSDRALAEAFEIMDAYNAAHDAHGRSRVEYVSDEMLGWLDRSRLTVTPMGVDYVYDVRRMIDLAGGDLASKRQLKNRFQRNYEYRAERYDAARHQADCLALLKLWKKLQDANHKVETLTSAVKRQKETRACELALEHAPRLGLKGMVVYVREGRQREGSNVGEEERTGESANRPTGDLALSTQDSALRTQDSGLSTEHPEGWSLRGFTFGEELGKDQSSIVIEKTDLGVRGLAQFIFSEFCRTAWADRPWVNAGDDWGLETLAWTKMSYRPVRVLQKYDLRLAPRLAVSMPVGGRLDAPALADGQLRMFAEPQPGPAAEPKVRAARKEDMAAALQIEQSCFSAYCLSKRSLQYLQRRPSAVFLVAEQAGRVIGEGISLVRQHKRGRSGRIYSLAVCGEHRGKRVGQKLLRAMIDDLASRGVKRVFLEVEQDNTPAIGLYQRNGFKAVDTLPDYYGKGRPGLRMVCDVVAGTGPAPSPDR